MLSVEQAVAELLAHSRLLAKPEPTRLAGSLGRVLAQEVVAGIDVPPADNSAMDGYAFRHADWPADAGALTISQRIPAGIRPPSLGPGTAARIFTGAEVPAGADTVVMQEHCREQEDQLLIEQLPQPGANIRRQGQDIRAGQSVLAPGRRLDAQAMGLVASLGIAELETYRPLRIAVISNGSELVEPGHDVAPGQIYNSNRYMLAGLVRGWGFELCDFGIAPDDPSAIRDLLLSAAAETDVILSSGGVSVGEEDHIKDVVESLGGIGLWKVSIKPGKPFAFGRVGDTPFIGLPGNPSSVLVTALIIARPFLLACQGHSETVMSAQRKQSLFAARGGPRQTYLRAKSVGNGVECHPRQSSGVLMSAVWGDGLVVQSPGQDIAKGDWVDFIPYALLT
jgi:molybdopterin molybdotransferase